VSHYDGVVERAVAIEKPEGDVNATERHRSGVSISGRFQWRGSNRPSISITVPQAALVARRFCISGVRPHTIAIRPATLIISNGLR